MDFGLIAFLIVIGGSMLVGAAGGAAKDVAHIAKGREGPLPSQEAADRRAKTARSAKRVGAKAKAKAKRQGKQRDGYMARLFANAAEQRRIKNAGKRQADRDWIEQHRDEFSEAGYRAEQAKLERKAGRRARRERALSAFRDAETGRIKAALAARKSDEGKTDKEVSDEQDQAEGESAKVLPFRQRATDKDSDGAANGIDDAIADEAAEQNKDGDEPERMPLEAMPDSVLEALARRDGDERQAAAKAILADRAARGTTVTPDEDEHWHVHDNGQIERTWYRRSEAALATDPDGSQHRMYANDAYAAPENTTQEEITMNQPQSTGEISSLGGAQLYADEGVRFSNSWASHLEQLASTVKQSSESLRHALEQHELAQSSLQEKGLTETAQNLAGAREPLELMLNQAQEAHRALNEMFNSSEGVTSAFKEVQNKLKRQSGASEVITGLGNDVAKDTAFYQHA